MQKLIIAAGIAVVICLLVFMRAQDVSVLEKVQSGELTLTCHFKDGIKDVPKEHVEDFDSDIPMWFFSGDGYATKCFTSRKVEAPPKP